MSLLLTGCGKKQEDVMSNIYYNSQQAQVQEKQGRRKSIHKENKKGETYVNSKKTGQAMREMNAELEENFGKMVTYEVRYSSRENPFMPYNEFVEYQNAKKSAILEANRLNSEIIKLKKLEMTSVREPDDISPYSFNLPVPPTSPGPDTSAVARITKTKVVGIMYNTKSPSAIINVDNKDYLVRPGDKIIGQEYIVTKINPTWVTASMGSNVYSAAIGELFSKDGIEENQTDIYDLKNRFGGRKI